MEDRKQNCFDFLRLFAASCVVITHSVEHLHSSFLWFKYNTNHWFFDGVPLFFILSDMLVYRSYEKCMETNKPKWAFFINRFLRVAPAIYMYLIIQSLLLFFFRIINFKSIFSIQYLGWIISNIFLIPVYNPGLFKNFGVGVINGSLWTIPAEVSFYLIVPIIYYSIKRFGIKHVIKFLFALSILFMIVQYVFNTNSGELIYTKFYRVFFMPHLIFFCIGIFLSKYWAKIKHNKYLFILSVFIYILIRYDFFRIEYLISPKFKALWAFPLGYSVIWFGNNAPLLFNRIIKVVGDLSYGVYVWHMVIINIFVHFNISSKLTFLPNTVNILIIYLTSILIAYFSWHLIEKQLLKLKPFTSNSQISILNQI